MTDLSHSADVPRSTLEELLAHGSWMHAFCRRLVGREEADDLAQETWLAALRRPPRERSSRAWLASVARNLARDRRRRALRRERREAVVARPEAERDTLELLQRTELAHLVAGEMLGLREPFRTTLVLRFVEGLGTAEVARRMNVPRSTVRTRVGRGLEEVRGRLDARHDGDRKRWLEALAPFAAARPRGGLGLATSATLIAGLLATGVGVVLGTSTEQLEPSASQQRVAATAHQEPEPAQLAPVAAAPAQRRPGAAAVLPATEPESAIALVAPRVAWHHAAGGLDLPLLVGERLVVGGSSLTCIDARDGHTLWEQPREERFWWTSPVHVDGLVIAAHSTGGIAAFDLAGQLVWSRSVEALGGTAHVGTLAPHAAGTLYVAPTSDGLVALRAESGATVWRTSLGGPVELTPALADGWLLAGTSSGTFAALQARDGSVLWTHSDGGQYGWTDPVVANGVVYVGDRGKGHGSRPEDTGKLVCEVRGERAGAVNALRVANGEYLWGRIFGATGLSTPFVDQEVLWIGCGSTCIPLRLEDGEAVPERVVRTGRNPFGTPRVIGGQLVFGNLDGHLYAHSATDGALLWSFSLAGEPQVGDWIAAQGRIFVGTGAGLVALEDPPGALPCPPGTRLVHELEPLLEEETVGVAGPAVFENGYELSARWLMVLEPEALSDHERELWGLPSPSDTGPVDLALRENTWQAVQAALEGSDDMRRNAALRTIARCKFVAGDAGLRSTLQLLAQASEPLERLEALRALLATGPEAGDLELVHAAWEVVPAQQRLKLPLLMVGFAGGVLEGRSAELVLELLHDIDAQSFGELAPGLWGARLSEELVTRMLEFATDPQHAQLRHDALYFVLSPLENKPRRVIEALLELCLDEQRENADRALWGLGCGIPEQQREWLVERLLGLEPDLHVFLAERLAAAVRTYGTQQQIERLAR